MFCYEFLKYKRRINIKYSVFYSEKTNNIWLVKKSVSMDFCKWINLHMQNSADQPKIFIPVRYSCFTFPFIFCWHSSFFPILPGPYLLIHQQIKLLFNHHNQSHCIQPLSLLFIANNAHFSIPKLILLSSETTFAIWERLLI